MSVPRPVFSKEQLSQIIERELTLHPLSLIIDLYKLVYQAYTGPTHMNPSPSILKRLLLAELNASRMHLEPFSYDIGTGFGYHRINICWLYDLNSSYQEAAADEFVRLINRSRLSEPYTIKEISEVWDFALPLIQEKVNVSDEDIKNIADLILNDQIPSHSDQFKQAYAPHYRLVHYTLMEETTDLMNKYIEV